MCALVFVYMYVCMRVCSQRVIKVVMHANVQRQEIAIHEPCKSYVHVVTQQRSKVKAEVTRV